MPKSRFTSMLVDSLAVDAVDLIDSPVDGATVRSSTTNPTSSGPTPSREAKPNSAAKPGRIKARTRLDKSGQVHGLLPVKESQTKYDREQSSRGRQRANKRSFNRSSRFRG